jgi:hypothetical protein
VTSAAAGDSIISELEAGIKVTVTFPEAWSIVGLQDIPLGGAPTYYTSIGPLFDLTG